MNPTQRLHRYGQSLWLDSLNRRMLRDDTLARYIDGLSVTGLTSNPTIIGRAMAAGHDYDDSLRAHLAAGVRQPEELVFSVVLEDIRAAADLLRPVWERTAGVDGYASIEVPPGLAGDAERSVEVARRLHRRAGRPNVLVKIPGTTPGLVAMEQLVAEGIGINVTLLFSNTQYVQTVNAYLRGLERRAALGESLDVPSVASVFVSRWDKAADEKLPPDMRGRLGVAVAEKVYASYRSVLTGQRWASLAAAGARPQRVLWASTSTKDPDLPDTYYVDKLAASETINTMPEKTLLAYADHGGPVQLMQPDGTAADQRLEAFRPHGIDIDALGQALQRDGAGAFEADWSSLLKAMPAKSDSLTIPPVGLTT